jgi:hypothetical protein
MLMPTAFAPFSIVSNMGEGRGDKTLPDSLISRDIAEFVLPNPGIYKNKRCSNYLNL